jgi:hypothetical protein
MNSLNVLRVAALAAAMPAFSAKNRVVEYLRPFAAPEDYLQARELVSQALAEHAIVTPFPNTEVDHARCEDALRSLDDHILELLRCA